MAQYSLAKNQSDQLVKFLGGVKDKRSLDLDIQKLQSEYFKNFKKSEK